MHEHASKYPFSFRSPHRTRRVILPDGVVRFPLKEEYDRQTRSISGLFEPMGEKGETGQIKEGCSWTFRVQTPMLISVYPKSSTTPSLRMKVTSLWDFPRLLLKSRRVVLLLLQHMSSIPPTCTADTATNGTRKANGEVVIPSIGCTLLINTVDVLFVVNRNRFVQITFHRMCGGKNFPF